MPKSINDKKLVDNRWSVRKNAALILKISFNDTKENLSNIRTINFIKKIFKIK